MLLTPRRRLVQRRLVAVPIGMFMHLLLDGIWTDTQAFWWPFAGLAWSDAQLPELARGPLRPRAGGARAPPPCGGAGGGSGSTSRPAGAGSCAPASSTGTWRRRDGRRAVIVVVRHGRTAANAGGLLLGRPTRRSTTRATGQAGALAAACADARRRPDRHQPARPVPADRRARRASRRAATPVEVDDRWIELDYGELDGVPAGRRAAPRRGRRGGPIPTWAPPGGESLAALGVRVRAACAEPGRPRRPTATSWSSATCRRSRRPWPGRSAWATRWRGACGWRRRRSPASAWAATGRRRCGPSTTCPPDLTAGGEPAPTTGHAWPWKDRPRISPVARSIVASQKQAPPSDTKIHWVSQSGNCSGLQRAATTRWRAPPPSTPVYWRT